MLSFFSGVSVLSSVLLSISLLVLVWGVKGVKGVQDFKNYQQEKKQKNIHIHLQDGIKK